MPRRYVALACAFWLIALAAATAGLFFGRAVFERGVSFGTSLPILPDVSFSRRSVNTQLEQEPDVESSRRALQLAKQAGFGWIRQQFAWSDIEPGAKGRFEWERADRIIGLAAESGLDVLARLDLPPEWARPMGSYKTHPPRDARDFGDFVEAFVRRYRGRVRYVQLWNEPNLNEEWGRRPVDPAGYAALLRHGSEGARRADPTVRVVSAALAQTLEPDDPSASGLDDLLYLERLYAAGARPYFDVLAVNAYGLSAGPDDRRTAPEHANFPRVLLARDVMLRHGDRDKAVWVAEFGWNALPPDWSGEPSPWGRVDPRTQADYVTGAFERAAAEWPWLGPMSLWLLRRPSADARDPTPYFALVDRDWHARPAFDALARSADRQPIGIGVYQESTPLLHYDGLWQWTPDPRAQLGELRESPISGAAVRWRFLGTEVSLVAPVGPARGIAFVKIDGAYTLANRLPLNANGQAFLDQYAPQAAPKVRIALATGLPDRVHDVELIVSGDRNAASTGAGVGIDAIAIARARPALPSVALGGAWLATALAAAAIMRPRWLPAFAPVARALPDTVAQASILGVVLALPFSPLVIRTPAGAYSPVELLSLAAIGVWLARLAFGAPRVRFAGAFTGPALLVVAAGCASTLVADYPHLALRELRTLVVEPALFYLAARSAFRGPAAGVALLGAVVSVAAAASALAILQTVTGRGLVQAEGVARAAALYRSPNNLALLLDRAVPMAIAGAVVLGRQVRWYFALTALLCCLALFLTFSRGAWLATSVGVAAVATPRLLALLRRRRGALLACVLALVPLTLLAVGAASRIERFRSLFSAEGTGLLRIHLWVSSLRMALDHPVLGVGLDQFLYHYPRYMHPDAWREPNLSHPHNILLDFWLRLGLPGLIALFWAAWVFIRRQSLASGAEGSEALRMGAAGAAIALTLHGLVDNSFFVIDLAYSCWLVCLIAELRGEPAWSR